MSLGSIGQTTGQQPTSFITKLNQQTILKETDLSFLFKNIHRIDPTESQTQTLISVSNKAWEQLSASTSYNGQMLLSFVQALKSILPLPPSQPTCQTRMQAFLSAHPHMRTQLAAIKEKADNHLKERNKNFLKDVAKLENVWEKTGYPLSKWPTDSQFKDHPIEQKTLLLMDRMQGVYQLQVDKSDSDEIATFIEILPFFPYLKQLYTKGSSIPTDDLDKIKSALPEDCQLI